MSKWEEVKLGDVIEFDPKVKLELGGLYEQIEMADIDPGHRYVYPNSYKLFKGGAKFCNGDTLFARITPCLQNGKIAQARGLKEGFGFGSTEFIVLRGKKGLMDNNFVYYLAQTDFFRHNAERSMTGATGRQRADKGTIQRLLFQLPPLPVQRQISSILSAYDDLIDNNLQRIRLLEEAARLEYQSLMQSQDETWEVKRLDEFAYLNPSIKISSEPAPFVPMTSLSEVSMVIDPIEERKPGGGAKFQNGDTLFARITPCLENGKTGFVQFLANAINAGTGSTEFIVLRSKSVNPCFIYCLARDYDFRDHAIKSMSGADGRQRVNMSALAAFQLAIPSKPALDEFEQSARSKFRLIYTLTDQNTRLKAARDLLLPRLMSGELAIPEDVKLEGVL